MSSAHECVEDLESAVHSRSSQTLFSTATSIISLHYRLLKALSTKNNIIQASDFSDMRKIDTQWC